MRFALEALGRWTPERRFAVEAERVEAYAAATNDVVRHGLAPPVFAVLPVWDVVKEATATVVPLAALPLILHGEQDIVLHEPLRAGAEVVARAAPIGVHAKASGTTVVVRTETRDPGGALLQEQHFVEFYRGVVAEAGGGEEAPEHRLPAGLGEPVAAVEQRIDEDQTFRYAEASGDHFAIHLDDEAARTAGLPGIVVHGLCVMAFTGRAALDATGAARLRRLAVRFSRPVRPGDALTTRVWALGGGAFAFESASGAGETVIRDGRAEIA